MSEFDYIVIGGGTAGCIIAAHLTEDPDVTVGLVEWGPSDEREPRARSIRRWAEMLEGEYDLDYRSVPQARGNSGIRQARLRILGGCSTANTMISWRPRVADLREWVDAGAQGWDAAAVHPYYDRLQAPITPVPAQDQNPFLADVVASASSALGLPVRSRWNDDDIVEGTGFFEIGYDPATNTRSSSSICYLHPAMHRANLRVLLRTRALRLLGPAASAGRPPGVLVRTADGATAELTARREVVVCAGAIDSPRLLQLSGIGPADVLGAADVDVRVDLPGVGGNLMDHAEGIVVWEVTEPPSPVCATGWDAGALLRLSPQSARPDVTMHFPVEAWVDHVVGYGVQMPAHYMAIAPNVAKPRSRGRVWITSADPDQRPAIDYRYFTDPDGADEAVLVAAVRRPPDRRVRADGVPAAARGVPWSGCDVGRGPVGAGSRDPPDRLPRQRNLPDGRRRRPAGRPRLPAAGAGRARPAGGGRVGVPYHPFGQPGGHGHADGRAGGRPDRPGPVIPPSGPRHLGIATRCGRRCPPITG